ncbi:MULTISPECIES: Eco57I restriction-modification methylase domain-containing protein [unclassified Rhodococcus (in: high G+C Gram-positive bacteria)]|uniref:Eco57I restriction-modification methylase domain-containing protein n=1 Tax=unclassified Rhodococcus (in: high G+C Gram-positive bacteria) TaxID=192944 RepID=UPI0019D14FBD|nr:MULTISPECIES: hypothetical protein [unclassified Rhodococcus (in: high G+C Gram-positive bacteria)]MCJ0894761.1 hypothetical protein [Rhodococcus sp. ARC_M5]
MSDFEQFLGDADVREIPWTKPTGAPVSLVTDRVLIADGIDALEIAVASAAIRPKVDEVRRLWSIRWGRRAAPVVLVVAYVVDGTYKAAVCGTKDDPVVLTDLDLSQVERICAAALSAPDQANAERAFHRLLIGQKDQLVAGLTNAGLFASHELRAGVPTRPDWQSERDKGSALLRQRGTDLIRGLGYKATPHGSVALILMSNDTHRAVAVLLDDHEVFDRPTARFGAVSPVAQGLAIAQQQGLPWLVITRGTQIRLYPAKPDVGVGRKGQAETFTELDLALLADSDAAYLPLLFSSNALSSNGSVSAILDASSDHAAALGKRLRDRVYVDVVPQLAVAVANRMGATSEADLGEAYHQTLIILFRLLFVSYAEDRGLLPYQRNPRYTKKALKTTARELAENPDMTFDPAATDRWDDLLAIWRAVDDGNKEWGVPAYNGGLFASDEVHPSGKAIAAMRLTNDEIGPALKALVVDTGEDGTFGPVDFRSLSVREFGTIYEGLLESSLSVAPHDLTVDPKTGAYLPAKSSDMVEIPSGQVYFHNASGSRKASGSYFTKAFAVEHLLDASLEPALTAHLEAIALLLEQGDGARAADKFFDFRVADLAMGSGHFLVAAIDRIENRFATFLANHPIPEVTEELRRLTVTAQETLGPESLDIELESRAVLRRQIARRCIYGLDLNLIAVELARLAIWIHTFVPGLPMSSLSHGLVVGNSLTGIATVEEVLDILDPDASDGTISIFEDQILEELNTARERLLRVARTSEATKKEVREATKAHAQARKDAHGVSAIFDAAIATRLGLISRVATPDSAIRAAKKSDVQQQIRHLQAAHFPVLFPEVFLRERPGFDVLLGNPPWEETTVEKLGWWALRFPGLKSLKDKAQKERITELEETRTDLVSEYEAAIIEAGLLRGALLKGPFPGMGTGDPDLYKAFTWRFWQALRQDGAIGVVLPRSALSAAGSAEWREDILTNGTFSDVTLLVNTKGWVFDDMEHRYTVGLVTIRKGQQYSGALKLRGPFASLSEYRQKVGLGSAEVSTEDFRGWSDGAAFPAIPDAAALSIFIKMRSHPRLDVRSGSWRARPQREFDATNDKKHFSTDLSKAVGWPVFKGASFDIWQPDTGTYYGWADPKHAQAELQSRRHRQARLKRSAFSEFSQSQIEDETTLPCLNTRIMFRDISRSTDTRTMRAVLVPAGRVATNKAPYFLFPSGDSRDEAYLLGVLCSIPLDWIARTVVELSMNFHILNGLPVPRPDPDSVLRKQVVEIAGRLAATDERYRKWADEVGVKTGSVADETMKSDLIAELDALVSLLYDLDRDEVVHVFETFHRGWNYQPRLTAVLSHFDSWKAKVTK